MKTRRLYNARKVAIDSLSYDSCVELYGGAGTAYDRAMAFYVAAGHEGTLHDREMAYLGAAGFNGTWYDRWFAYLGSKGMTGTIGDRFGGSWSF